MRPRQPYGDRGNFRPRGGDGGSLERSGAEGQQPYGDRGDFRPRAGDGSGFERRGAWGGGRFGPRGGARGGFEQRGRGDRGGYRPPSGGPRPLWPQRGRRADHERGRCGARGKGPAGVTWELGTVCYLTCHAPSLLLCWAGFEAHLYLVCPGCVSSAVNVSPTSMACHCVKCASCHCKNLIVSRNCTH